MSSTASIPLHRPALSATRLVGALRTEAGLARLAISGIALHVVDDNFLQPPPGTGPGDHLVSGLVPLALLALVAWAYPRLRGGRRGALALLVGFLGLSTGVEALHYANNGALGGDDYTGLLTIPSSLGLLALGAVTLWRTRRNDGSRVWRYSRRVLLGVAGGLIALVLTFPIAFGYVTTHTARAFVPANELGVPYEDVTFTTSDGLELRGWYIPSRNGAAVISFPGRKGPQRPARMLAEHGYGVLLFDRRGEGVSDGDPHAFGWGGERDVKAAVAYLQQRPDVDPARIGGIGLSVGGEMMLDATADTPGLKAVVSEGAGARSVTEELDWDHIKGLEKVVNGISGAIKTGSHVILSNQLPPEHLADLVARSSTPMLMIAAPNSGHGEGLNRMYAEAAGDNATLWEIPESGHVGGMDSRPEEYERRVVGFFDREL